MDNNFDPNQQPQYQQAPQYQPQYQAPNQQYQQQPQYQQAPQYQQQPQYQQAPQYQQPLYEQNYGVAPKSILIMAIIGIALGATGLCTIAGIILCAIAISKANSIASLGFELPGIARAGKIVGTIGLVVSIVMTVVMIISFCIGFYLGYSGVDVDPYVYFGDYYF